MFNDKTFIYITASFLAMLLYFHFEMINKSFQDILKVLRLKKPGLVFISLRQGDDGMLKFVLVLPQAGASDVVSREVRLSVADVLYEVDLAGDVVETAEFTGEDNAVVTGTLVDVDDAGNRSEAREFSFVLVDTVAPPQPGELSIKVTGEE